MSENIATPSAAEPVVGSTENVGTDTTASETPILSVDEYANYVVPVKLDGEELQVPLSEAIAGYQRQADYTRKTQELAQQREQMQFAAAIQSALERDPEATIDLLTRHYGISRAEARAVAAEVEDVESLDPQEKRLRELDQRIASFEDFQSQQQIEREVARLQSKYSDFNVAEVVQAALKANSADLEGTYKQLSYDKIQQQRQLESQAKERQQSAEKQVVEAKRQAAVVSGGSSATASTTTETAEPIRSISEAWAAAKRQLNAEL
jgi:hypothetical protein